MSVHEREGLIARIRQMRRMSPDAEKPASAPADARDSDLRALETRIADLEKLVQGLQDSVHRETSRLSTRLAEVEATTQPAALAKALSKDARERGL